MNELTAVEQIDHVIELIYNLKKAKSELIYQQIRNDEVHMPDHIIDGMLYQLRNDGYIITESDVFLTFSGLLLRERGGYAAKLKRENSHYRWTNYRSWFAIAIAGVAAIITAISAVNKPDLRREETQLSRPKSTIDTMKSKKAIQYNSKQKLPVSPQK